jgi:two-component system, NarL family, nitrate/nitrite response regulator NarL
LAAAPYPRNRPVTVVIADDEPLFVEMVRALLADEAEIEVAGTARNGLEAVDLAAELQPDVTLMDISMPLLDGIEATRRIRNRDPKACILMLSGSNVLAEIARSRQAGAAGYLTKDRVGSELVHTILDVARN